MDFEAKLESFYNQLSGHLLGGDIVDVGAHIGRHAIPLAKLCGSLNIVWACEPLPDMRTRLGSNAALESVSNIAILPFAIGDSHRMAEFNYLPETPEESGLLERGTYNIAPGCITKLRVPVHRLDDLIHHSRKIVFLKIDVEGGERDVLKGASLMLVRNKPVVAFECGLAAYKNYHESPHEIWYELTTKGYEIYSITGVRMSSVDMFCAATVAQNWWDYIALPEDMKFASQFLVG